MDQRCKCGEVAIPNGWGGVETLTATGVRMHWFDRCADMFVYDEVREISPEAWARLADSAPEQQK